MKNLLNLDKKGISGMVAYALLIAIAITLSILVYNWLRFYASGSDIPECPTSVNIVIDEYTCMKDPNGFLNITLANRGLFTIDGYTLRIHDRVGAEFGLYTINATGSVVLPGEIVKGNYSFTEGINHRLADADWGKIDKIAQHKVNLGFNLPLFDDQADLDIRVNYASKRKADESNTWLQTYKNGYAPDYTVTHLAFTYHLNASLKGQLLINNLFNEQYYV